LSSIKNLTLQLQFHLHSRLVYAESRIHKGLIKSSGIRPKIIRADKHPLFALHSSYSWRLINWPIPKWHEVLSTQSLACNIYPTPFRRPPPSSYCIALPACTILANPTAIPEQFVAMLVPCNYQKTILIAPVSKYPMGMYRLSFGPAVLLLGVELLHRPVYQVRALCIAWKALRSVLLAILLLLLCLSCKTSRCRCGGKALTEIRRPGGILARHTHEMRV
jgi:hypothetical protein